jgi:large subunit ribosomal protein L13
MTQSKKTKIIVNRERHVIDATDKAPGRMSTQIATLLMGKNKPTYRPHMDQGDFVQISNVAKVKFSGKKMIQKKYYHPTFYPGGLKTKPLWKAFQESPSAVIKKMVYRMLPKNKLRESMIKRLTFKA